MTDVLTEKQIRQYRDDGYVSADNLFAPAELDELERQLDALFDRRSKNQAQLDATWKGDWKSTEDRATEIRHTHDLQAYSAAWAGVLTHDRLTRALAGLLGADVQLHHTKAFVKPPRRGSAFPMHQDHPYFPHALGTMMAAILFLSDATEEMGCFRVYPGTHRGGPLPVVDEGQPRVDEREYPIQNATPVPARRGDVVFFNYLLVHGSDRNRSNRPRKSVLFQVRDPADRPLYTHRDNSHALGFMMRGINPLASGETIAAGSGT